METVKVNASLNYEVKIASGLLDNAGSYISDVFSGSTAFIVSDDNVFSIYGERLKKSLTESGFKTAEYVFPHGEKSKTLDTYAGILEAMYEGHVSRSDTVIALGGGVTGDMAGFAAATYQRGIGFIQIPTSLLADVDSSVGGKTGVDLPGGKNQVGAFYQPSVVLCDTDTLATLPEDEYRNGCAEIIKYAMLGSESLFESLSATPVSEQYERVIAECVSMKRDFVEADERDLGCRMMLNLGHTAGHAVETCSNYTIAHGKAVAIGMAIITRAACSFGYCKADVCDRLVGLLEKYGLPTETSFCVDELAVAGLTDKKRSGNTMTLVVPEEIGKCKLVKIQKDEFKTWLNAGGVK